MNFQLKQQLTAILGNPSRFLDVAKIQVEKELFDLKVTINNQRLAEKKKEASQIVELESLNNVCDAIKTLLTETNVKITEHNRIVANLAKEKRALTANVWRFVIEELSPELNAYKNKKEGLQSQNAVEIQLNDQKASQTTQHK